MRKAIMSVISDLSSDQRVHKVAMFLHENNCELLLVGRELKNSLPIPQRPYQTRRLYCRYTKGIMKYAEFHLKLFWFLLFNKADFYISNDLDSLLPNFVISKLRKCPLVYDSHEYFTGVPDLSERPFKRKAWKFLENMLLPTIKYAYTVNQSISNLYKKEYGIDMKVVRNLPLIISQPHKKVPDILPKDKTFLIMQGAGINQNRGYEEAIMAMEFLPDSFMLLIIGNGEVIEQLKSLTKDKSLQQKVQFIPRVPYEDLGAYTQQAFLGLSLDKPVSINHKFSLPNKIFDYIKSGVPILSSALPEIKKILEQYCVGRCIDNVDPKIIARNILEIYNDQETYQQWKLNTTRALNELNWNKEKPVLMEIYGKLIK